MKFDPEQPTPRDLRETFVTALKRSLFALYEREVIDNGQLEELLRALPGSGRA